MLQKKNIVPTDSVIGVDLGGTKILACNIKNGKIINSHQVGVPKNGTQVDVLSALYECIDKVIDESTIGIGIGVPSVVDIKLGIVYDVQNIVSWKKVYLKDLLFERYQIEVFVNNDANCFAIGEKYFGEGKNYQNIAAVITGTGMAAGLVINDKLYNGFNCGAGEFGMIPYLDHNYEYYASGQFFENIHRTNGQDVYQAAKKNDKKAINIFREYGNHLGNALNAILYSIDPEVIILGGSVSKGFEFYKSSMWETIHTLAYSTISENITIRVSANPKIAVLGAAALYFDSKQIKMKV